MTQNRYYSNTAALSFIANPGGIDNVTNALILTTTTGFPSSFPFVLRLNPLTQFEEAVLITGGLGTSGTPYTMTRGFDGTTPGNHLANTPVQHGIVQADLAEPQQHINSGFGAGPHGLPANAWLGGTFNLIERSQQDLPFPSPWVVSNIPQTYQHLFLLVRGRTENTSISSGIDGAYVAWNNMSSGYNGLVYSYYGGPSSGNVLVSSGTSQSNSCCGIFFNKHFSSEGSGQFIVWFPFYASTIFKKMFFAQTYASDGGTASQSQFSSGSNSSSTNNNAITTLSVVTGSTTSFSAGTSFSLYGVN